MSHQITTDRLILRTLVPDDGAQINMLIGDFDVTRWLTRAPYPYSERDAADFINKHSNARNTLAITENNVLMGVVSHHDELGYWIGKPFWGNGFATEAAQAVVDTHFSKGHETLVSGHLLENAASRAVLCKLGFANTVTEKRPSASLGRSVDVQRMQLALADWQARP